jgi:hypothetical protein
MGQQFPRSREKREAEVRLVKRSSLGPIFSGSRPADSVPGPDPQDGDPRSGTGGVAASAATTRDRYPDAGQALLEAVRPS